MRHVKFRAESIRQVLSEWLTASPELGVLALVPEAEKTNLPELQAICRDLGVQLLGGVFPALIRDQKFVTDGLLLLPFAQRVPAFLLPSGGDAELLSEAVLSFFDDSLERVGRPTLFLMFDAMLPNIASVLEDLYARLADRVRYAGVNAGSETFQSIPCLFDEKQVLANAVLGFFLPGNAATVLAHGYKPPEKMLSASSAEGNRISMIDWQPAFTVYQALIKAQFNVELTPENFYQYGVHFPFGILRANGEVVVRIPVGLGEDGSIFCVGEVPENSILVLLKSPAANEGACIEKLAQALVEANGSLTGKPLLTFFCAGRRLHLGEEALLELDLLHQASGVSEMAGALSLGEIGCTQYDSYPLFQNATFVCTPWEGR